MFYFIIRLINLTKLPIFNDEAIYLDWGWREIHRPGNLYYSLYDAKQPFLMWIFGIMESIFPDPLFAGRVVSVLTGFLTLVGIWRVSKYLFAEKVAIIAAVLYISIPLFSFYDRLALMESSVMAVGIWSGYCLIKLVKDKASLKYPIILGLIFGIGFFIKSSALVFFIAYLVTVLIHVLFFRQFRLIVSFFYTAVIFLASVALLLINPQFWDTLSLNSRYTLTLSEILAFPFSRWAQSFLANIQIGFYGITPLLFLASLIGITIIFIRKDSLSKHFLSFFLTAFLITTIVVSAPTDRYLVAFLPFLIIPAACLIYFVISKHKIIGEFSLVLVFIVPFYLTVLQVAAPAGYLLLTEKLTYFTNGTYLRGATAGYGVNETIDYLNSLAGGDKMIVTVAENTGNPESAILVYFNKSPNVQVIYMDGRYFPSSVLAYDCFSSQTPVYFVAREEQLVGLDKFLQKMQTIKNPYGPNSIGIYTLKKNCKGKTLELKPVAA